MSTHDDENGPDSGVKVVGASSEDDQSASWAPPNPTKRSQAAAEAGAVSAGSGTADRTRILAVVAALGLVGTLVFGLLWGLSGSGSSTPQDPAVISTARTFLTDFFNFNAKTVDSDFNAVTAMATGSFSTQAKQFFNSAIRTDLEKALAESRGQIRTVYIQAESGTTASLYAVIDQVYVNNKITTPQSDVVRILIDLQKVGSTWKISNVTVLEGASPASAGSASGSAGSSVPGQ